MNRILRGLAISAILAAGFAAAVPAFATSLEPTKALTIDYISAPTTLSISGNTIYQYVVKVSGLTINTSKPFPPDLVGFHYGNFSQGTQNGDSGTLARSASPGQFAVKHAGSQVFTVDFLPSQIGSGTQLDVAEYSRKVFTEGLVDATEIRQESTPIALNGLPYGQLPEVPWAAELPLTGVGVGAVAWLLKRRTLTL